MIKVKSGIIEIKTKDPYMRSFLVSTDRGNARINVWHNKKNHLYTVGTHLVHPKKGANQLFRRNCTEKEVMEILKNPRIHTGKGYR